MQLCKKESEMINNQNNPAQETPLMRAVLHGNVHQVL